MKKIKLGIYSGEGFEASVECDGSQGGYEDYFAVVSIKGVVSEKRIHGVDPIQAFALAMTLIADRTEDKRFLGEEGQPIDGASWSIQLEADA